jgi:hypothetical protein
LNKDYAMIWVGDKKYKLHRYIMKCFDPAKHVDHINTYVINTLDNRRQNLRIVTPRQNAMNQRKRKGTSSKYIGVCWDKINEKWRASIKIGVTQHLGSFDDEIEAGKARDKATKKHFGKHGKLNFPDQIYTVTG